MSRPSSLIEWLPGLAGAALLSACVHLADNGEVVWGGDSASRPSASASADSQATPNAGPPTTPRKTGKVEFGHSLRLTGSTTVGAVLAPRLAVGYLRSLGAVKIDTSERKDEHVTVVGGDTRDGHLDITISTPGSKGAFEALAKGDCDVGLSSRPISEEEISRLASLGDMSSDAAEHVIAVDGVAIVVNKQNAVGELSLDEAAALFSKPDAHWSTGASKGSAVHVFSRDEKSGTNEVFAATVLRGAKVAPSAQIFAEGPDLSEAVAKDPLSIGFVSFSQVGAAKPIAVRDGKAAAIAPSAFSIATEDYPLSRRLFLYVSPKTARPHASELVAFALSDAGQEIVDETGFVSLKVRSDARGPVAEGPSAYTRATKSAQRLAVDFRFQTASAKLDAKGRADLVRVAEYAKAEGDRKLLLFGFTDDQGDAGRNSALSHDRAKSVATELEGKGAHVEKVDGFGSAIPIATNETEAGRRRNRRVEVWMR
jgi:phosphate transport system substrate-binding protein